MVNFEGPFPDQNTHPGKHSPESRGRLKAIKSIVGERIAGGQYASGQRLPSERQLCLEFETPRVTLRETLTQLEREGLIYREERRGWFVSPPRFIYNPQTRGHFSLAASQQGRMADTRTIDWRIVTASPRVAQLLGVSTDTELARIRRVRSIDGRAILYVEHYCFPEVFPGLFDHDLTASLTELYRDVYDFHYGRMQYQIIPTVATGDAANWLRVSEGCPALLVTRVNHSLDERVRDCDLEYWRHDAVLVGVDVRTAHVTSG